MTLRPLPLLLAPLLFCYNSALLANLDGGGYSWKSPRLTARYQPTTPPPTREIDYEKITHHTSHKAYHSALTPRHDSARVTIQFHTKQEITDARGPDVNGYAVVHRDGRCEIHTMMPYNWNDDNAMRTLGHELLHCLGAAHEP